MGGLVRTSGQTSATMQPPAAEAHVDFTTRSANMIAARIYNKVRPDGAGYDRFICFSLWRALSPPPQDMPLALCEGGSVRDDEGTANTKVDVDIIPTGDALFAPIKGEEDTHRGYRKKCKHSCEVSYTSAYCSYDYQKKLQAHGLQPSMSGKGNCYDNASVEACPKIPWIIGCCALQIPEGRTNLAAEMANTAAG